MMGGLWDLAAASLLALAGAGAGALAVWQNRRAAAAQAGAPARAMALALAVSALWALAALGDGGMGLAEAILRLAQIAWLWALYRLFACDQRDQIIGPIRPVVVALALVELLHLAMVLAAFFLPAESLAGAGIARLSTTLGLLFCIGALVLVHNLYAGAGADARAALRWPAAALGLMWLYDLNLHTISYLAKGAPALLTDLRAAALLAAVVLLGLGWVGRDTGRALRPSRSFAFQSFSLLLIGSYLLVMVLLAQGIAYAGNEYGRLLQIAFVVLASALALAILPSRKLRRWLQVMLSKHLFQHRYDNRAEWLRFTQTIGRAGPQAPPLPQRIVQAVADIADSPAGLLLTPREEGGMALVARWQWPAIEVPGEALSAAGASFFARSGFILDLDDFRKGHRQAICASACPDWLLADQETWAMVPLLHYERLVGLVVLARPPLARRLDWEDFDLLRVVGRQLASYLAEQASQNALGEAQRFDEFNRRIAFVMHDIKNLASQLSLLARNAQRHAHKPEFRDDMILTLRNSTDKLQALLARLGRYGAQPGSERQEVDLAPIVQRVAGQYQGRHPVVALVHGPCQAEVVPEALEQALAHLVQNAIEASRPDRPVLLELRSEPGAAIIELVDSGCGMSAEFVRNALFRPFHSSKPGGFGIGAFEARELVRAMGGRLEVQSREGLGTRFVLRLPTPEASALMRNMREASPAPDQGQEVA